MEIYPSLISSDLLNLRQTISELDTVCHGYHIDIMDDHFVPNLTWGAQFVNAIRKATVLPLQIHLMVDEPIHWLDRLETNPKGASFLRPDKTIPLHLQAPALSYKPENMPEDMLFFHQETLPQENQRYEFIQAIHYKGFKAGIAINPNTAVETILNTLPLVDAVLLMSVEPGFSGQKFITETLKKIKPLVAFRQQHQKPLAICMDGGINENNISTIVQHKVDQIAVASAIFDTPDPIAALKKLYTHIRS
jgi:ribulose-phosphate 3-epimerase